MAESANVKVFARFRPFNKRELAIDPDARRNLKFVDGSAGVEVEGKRFTFDRCFDTETQQGEFYNTVAQATIHDIFKGYNGTIFAYGQVSMPSAHCRCHAHLLKSKHRTSPDTLAIAALVSDGRRQDFFHDGGA